MPLLLHLCDSFSLFNPSVPLTRANILSSASQTRGFLRSPKCSVAKTPNFSSKCFRNSFYTYSQVLRPAHVLFCSKNEVFEELEETHLSEKPENEDFEELGLLGKPSPKLVDNHSVEELVEKEEKKPDKDEVLENFYKFFKPRDSLQLERDTEKTKSAEDSEKVSVEYYEPKPGDLVVGVVVSGNENKLDVNVGADLLGTMLTKEVLPLYEKEMNYLLCDVEKNAEEFMVRGKVGILENDEAVSGEPMAGRPVVEPGTVLFAEVLGRTLSGRPLLSTRRHFRRVAWHRVRQVLFSLSVPCNMQIGSVCLLHRLTA